MLPQSTSELHKGCERQCPEHRNPQAVRQAVLGDAVHGCGIAVLWGNKAQSRKDLPTPPPYLHHCPMVITQLAQSLRYGSGIDLTGEPLRSAAAGKGEGNSISQHLSAAGDASGDVSGCALPRQVQQSNISGQVQQQQHQTRQGNVCWCTGCSSIWCLQA